MFVCEEAVRTETESVRVRENKWKRKKKPENAAHYIVINISLLIEEIHWTCCVCVCVHLAMSAECHLVDERQQQKEEK